MTWDMENEILLGDDGGCSYSLTTDMMGALKHPPGRRQGDAVYLVSVQLPEDTILTAYYITDPDVFTHTAVTRWKA